MIVVVLPLLVPNFSLGEATCLCRPAKVKLQQLQVALESKDQEFKQLP